MKVDFDMEGCLNGCLRLVLRALLFCITWNAVIAPLVHAERIHFWGSMLVCFTINVIIPERNNK